MKILVVGNHACGNRGDGAIIRGLVQELESKVLNLELTLMSRFPNSSEMLIGREFKNDWIYNSNYKADSILSKIKRKVRAKILLEILKKSIDSKKAVKKLPIDYQNYIKELSRYDLIIQVGGSFFVDLYGVGQFKHAICALASGTPIAFLGHSVGPFQDKEFNSIAKKVFNSTKLFGLRESVSKTMVEESFGLPENYVEGADTAWLVRPIEAKIENKALLDFVNSNMTIAITLRVLAPFDKRLGVSQHQYEEAFAKLCNRYIEQGYNIIACSTCTGIDGYTKDDRIVAYRVGKLIIDKTKYKVVMDELNDVELGTLLSYCELTIGTRLHSAIISMNFGTPAFAINYEHKSKGIMKQLGLPELGIDVSELMDGKLFDKSNKVLTMLDKFESKMNLAVQKERERASTMITLSLTE
jgi:colanic acid/amylovoran biosynthesis protein